MYQDIDGKRVQEHGVESPEEMGPAFCTNPTPERLTALLQILSTALVSRDYDLIGRLRKGLRRFDRDNCDKRAEMPADALLETLDFARQHLLRTRPKSVLGVDLSSFEFNILLHLFKEPCTRALKVAIALGINEAPVVAVLRELIDRNLVAVEDDTDPKEYYLTDDGRRAIYPHAIRGNNAT